MACGCLRWYAGITLRKSRKCLISFYIIVNYISKSCLGETGCIQLYNGCHIGLPEANRVIRFLFQLQIKMVSIPSIPTFFFLNEAESHQVSFHLHFQRRPRIHGLLISSPASYPPQQTVFWGSQSHFRLPPAHLTSPFGDFWGHDFSNLDIPDAEVGGKVGERNLFWNLEFILNTVQGQEFAAELFNEFIINQSQIFKCVVILLTEEEILHSTFSNIFAASFTHRSILQRCGRETIWVAQV